MYRGSARPAGAWISGLTAVRHFRPAQTVATAEVERLFGDPSSYLGYHDEWEYAPCNCPDRPPCKRYDR